MALELKNVAKRVGADVHIHPTNLSFEPGSFNVLLGTTLAGKTTLMQMMAGLEKPTSGEVWFNGNDVTGIAVQKRNVSMVYQQFINYPNMSVFDNIASPLRVARAAGRRDPQAGRRNGRNDADISHAGAPAIGTVGRPAATYSHGARAGQGQ